MEDRRGEGERLVLNQGRGCRRIAEEGMLLGVDSTRGNQVVRGRLLMGKGESSLWQANICQIKRGMYQKDGSNWACFESCMVGPKIRCDCWLKSCWVLVGKSITRSIWCRCF